MRFSVKTNRCRGWFQPVVTLESGERREGAKWPTKQEAISALGYFKEHGIFPSEEDETPVEQCPHCGQMMPDKS